jgi:signal transduction histidine kinase
VTNLLANAVKYTPSGGRIALSVALEGDRKHAMIEVADSGPGVPVEYRERVFERFFRVEHARGGDVGAGVGIGLYIARQITEANGGRIHCDDSDAGGARFVITVPTESERNAALQ